MLQFPERPIDPPRERPLYQCDRCHQDIQSDEDVYEFEQMWICPECLVDLVSDMDAQELSEWMGLNSMTAEEAFKNE